MTTRREWSGAGVIVTGAGSGLGAEVCRVFAAEGARVLMVGRDEGRLARTREELGGSARFWRGMFATRSFAGGRRSWQGGSLGGLTRWLITRG